MKRKNRNLLIFICAIVFALAVLASRVEASDLVAPFHGVNAGSLCSEPMVNSDTIGCWDGTINSAGGLLDATENLILQSESLDTTWVAQGNAVVTADCAYGPDGEYTADKVYVEDPGNALYQIGVDVGDEDDSYSSSFYIKRISKTGVLNISNSASTTSGLWLVDFSKLGDGWERISRNHYAVVVTNEMEGHGATGAGGLAFRMAVGTAEFYLTKVQIESQRGLFHVGPYIKTTTVKKTRLDMTATGSPPSIDSDLQSSDGNRLRAMSFDGATQWQSHAHDSVMDMWDGDVTLTMVMKSDTYGKVFFANGIVNADGIYCQMHNYDYFCLFNNSGSHTTATSQTCSPDDGIYHVVQIIRNSNIATLYVDGVAGTSVDVTGFGIDHSRDLYFARYASGGLEYECEILYVRIDKKALSEDELSRQADVLMGMASSVGRYSDSIWDVERTTIASQEFSNKTLADKAVDTARVGDGILVEAQATNLCTYSQTFNSWIKNNLTVVSDTSDVLAPDGSQTVDILHEDASIDTYHRAYRTAMPMISGKEYTYSVFVKKGLREWVYINGTGSINISRFYNVSNGAFGIFAGAGTQHTAIAYPNGFYKLSVTAIATATGNSNILIYVCEGDNDNIFTGADQDSLYVWQAQVEEGLYATSPIETDATAVTRTADNVTLDLHVADSPYLILPPTISGPFSIEFDAKCLFEDNTDIAASKTIISISGNTGTADANTNNFSIQVATDGKLSATLYDSADTLHSLTTATDPTPFNGWFKVKAYMDLSDLSNNDLWLNGSNASITKVANTGTATWSTLFNAVRIGQDYSGTVSGDCKIKNLRISPKEF